MIEANEPRFEHNKHVAVVFRVSRRSKTTTFVEAINGWPHFLLNFHILDLYIFTHDSPWSYFIILINYFIILINSNTKILYYLNGKR